MSDSSLANKLREASANKDFPPSSLNNQPLTDEQAFDKALMVQNPHTWLGQQRLGFYNSVRLHQALILKDISLRPMLERTQERRQSLQDYQPNVFDISGALKNNAFYYALMNVMTTQKTIPENYLAGIALNKGYGHDFLNELKYPR